MSKEAKHHPGVLNGSGGHAAPAGASGGDPVADAACVLVGPTTLAGTPELPPSELMASIARRGLKVHHTTEPFDAMARLMVHEREMLRGRRKAGAVLMILEPSRVPGAMHLVAAAAKYARGTVCWQYIASAKPQLSPIDAEALLKAAAQPTSPASPMSIRGPAPAPSPGIAPAIGMSGGFSGGMSGGASGGTTLTTWVGPSRAPGGPNRVVRPGAPAAKLRLAGEGPSLGPSAMGKGDGAPAPNGAAPTKPDASEARNPAALASLSDDELAMLLGTPDDVASPSSDAKPGGASGGGGRVKP